MNQVGHPQIALVIDHYLGGATERHAGGVSAPVIQRAEVRLSPDGRRIEALLLGGVRSCRRECQKEQREQQAGGPSSERLPGAAV
jgi:hypothetical protein